MARLKSLFNEYNIFSNQGYDFKRLEAHPNDLSESIIESVTKLKAQM